jgi:hypothetical protein
MDITQSQEHLVVEGRKVFLKNGICQLGLELAMRERNPKSWWLLGGVIFLLYEQSLRTQGLAWHPHTQKSSKRLISFHLFLCQPWSVFYLQKSHSISA